MIYLIGGPPRCGKTTLTKLLSSKLGIHWVSADTLESIALVSIKTWPGFSYETHYAEAFPKNILRRESGGGNDEMYALYSAEEIAQAYIKQAEVSWPAIETMITCESQEGHDYIIEGFQITPEFVSTLDKDLIKAVFIIKKDAVEISMGLQKNSAKNDWAVQKTKNPETFLKIGQMISTYGSYFEQEAEKYEYPVFNTETAFHAQIELAATYLSPDS
jgi:2-phosphoglycerate kinase